MMILHDDLSKDGAYQQYMPNRTTVILQNFPFCFLSTLSKENYERSGNSRKMVVYYSKRFPDMYINSSFYEEIMAIAEMHVGLYRKYLYYARTILLFFFFLCYCLLNNKVLYYILHTSV